MTASALFLPPALTDSEARTKLLMASVFLCGDSLRALHLTFGLKGDTLAVIHPQVTASQCVTDGLTISSGHHLSWQVLCLDY